MDDKEILGHIDELIQTEHELRAQVADGKLPSDEALLHRRVPEGFISVWDAWLRECLAVSRQSLGERWLDIYLTSPFWRFACAPGACGPDPIAGLLAPSVDRIGGYFPLTLMWRIPPELHPLAVPSRCSYWFDRSAVGSRATRIGRTGLNPVPTPEVLPRTMRSAGRLLRR